MAMVRVFIGASSPGGCVLVGCGEEQKILRFHPVGGWGGTSGDHDLLLVGAAGARWEETPGVPSSPSPRRRLAAYCSTRNAILQCTL